jgi:malonyl-CoA O-methyltransferase
VAVLQREVGARLLERVAVIRMQPDRILDLGAGTGHVTRLLRKAYPAAGVIGVDIAHAMLLQARSKSGWWRRPKFVCGDMERLPFQNQSVDMLISNVSLQWCNDLDAVFAEFRRVLRPGGALFFSTFGPDTLRELRSSWQVADDYSHVNAFLDMHDVGDALVRAGLAEPVLDVERITLTYAEVRGLMSDLKVLGAHNVTQGRARGLTGRGAWRAMLAAYEKFRRDGLLPATYEVVYGHAWAPLPRETAANPNHAVRIPVTAITGRREDK